MALIKSAYESNGYNIHYGTGASDAYAQYNYPWPLNVLHGKTGIISDSIVIGSEDFAVESIIFGEKFQEESLIIDAKFSIETASSVQTSLSWAIFDEDTDAPTQIGEIFNPMLSDTANVFRDMSNNLIRLSVPAKSWLGLVNLVGGVAITNCQFAYTILYSTN